LDKIENLQSHENNDVYRKAYDLIENYFGAEDEDEHIAPDVSKAIVGLFRCLSMLDALQGFEKACIVKRVT